MAEFKFADEPSAEKFKFADEPQESKDTSLLGAVKQYGGAAQAAIDMAASMPGLAVAATAAGRGLVPKSLDKYLPGESFETGRGPTETVGEVMQSAQEGNPLNMLPDNYLGLRKTEGYDVANKYMGAAFSGIGQGMGNIAAYAADKLDLPDETKAKIGDWTDAIVQAGMLAGGMKQGAGLKPGSLEFQKANAAIKPKYAPEADSGRDLNYVPGQKRPVVNTADVASRDTSLRTTDIPTIEPDKTLAYTWKNKEVLDKMDQVDSRRGSDIPGVDFTTISLENPEHIENLKTQLDSLGIKNVDDNQARLLISQMQDKAIKADEEAKRMAHTITRRIKPLAVTPEALVEGLKQINASPMNAHVELVPTQLMELMRDHDRLTAPKSQSQFLEKENSVLEHGVNKGLTLSFWPEEGRIVQTNGNTRRGVAAKHGMMEIPAYVRVMAGRVPEEWSKSAVSIPGLKWEGSKPEGQFAKPSDIGLPSRKLNDGVFNPQIKYSPDPTLSKSTITMPAGSYQNNYLFQAQHEILPKEGGRKGLSIIRDTSSIPWYRSVARLLLNDEQFNPNFAVKDKLPNPTNKTKEDWGQYSPSKYEASVRKDATGNEYVFMHEMIHARTHSIIQQLIFGTLDRMHPSYDAAKRVVELWQNLSIEAEIRDPDLPQFGPHGDLGPRATSGSPLAKVAKAYGITDPHEFVTEAFTNPEFQNLLKQISLPEHMQTKGFRYYWDAFVQTLGDLIGIKRGDNNYLAATLEAGTELMRNSDKKDRMFYMKEQKPDAWTPRNLGVESRGDFIEDMVDAKRLGSVDTRHLQQVVNDKRITSEGFKDLDTSHAGDLLERLWGGAKWMGRQLADARTIEALNKAVPGVGDLLTNISGRVFKTDRWTKGQIEETLHGKEFAAHKYDPRGFVHRLGSRDGVNPTFDWLGARDGAEMLKVWLPNIGKKELFRSDFANDRQWQGYNVLQNQLDRALGIVNSLREQLGKPIVDRVMSYFPASRGRGDYKVVSKDAMGNQHDLSLFENEFEAKHFVKTMKKEFPYLEVSDPFHREKYQPGETDYTIWDEAERINSNNHELTQLIQRAKADYFTRIGMGGHLLKRRLGDDIGGYKGSDFDPKSAREGLQDYFEYAYNHAGNMQKKVIERELNELTIPHPDGEKPLSDVAPNLSEYLHQFVNKSMGKHNIMDQSEQVFFGEVSRAFGLGESAPNRGMAKLSRAAMVWYLFKTGFFISQPFQTFNALPHLVDMNGGNIPKALGHYLEGWQRTLMPSAEDRAGVNWAVRNEWLDPTTQHLLDDYKASVPTRVFLRTSGAIERELVRTPAFLMFEHALRDTISDPEKRYEAAAEKMAYSMSMTNKSNSPLIWEKLGIIGQGMRQLKSYSTNIWGQFAYFMNEAGTKGNYKPLGTFLATEALVSGVKGIIGIAEATAAINAFNYLTSSNVQTPEEWMLTSPKVDSVLGRNPKLKDAATYGLAAAIAGRDISNQVGNPSGFSYFDPIPFKFAWQIAEANVKYNIAAAQGQLTDDIRMQTWLANTPTALHEWVRNWFTNPGQPVPKPGMNMQGTYYRDEQAKVLSSVSGTKSVEETRADALQRFFKQHEQHITTNRGQLQNSMVDDALGGKGIDPSKIQEYIMQGGDVKNLAGDLKDTIIQRHRSAIFNQIISKSKSPSQAQKLRDVGPYLQNQPENIYSGSGSNKEQQFKFSEKQ